MKPPTPTTLANSPDLSFRTGALVMFEQDGSSGVGAILGFKKQSYQVLTMRGREIELKPNRLHPLGGTLPTESTTTEAKTKFLLALYESSLKQSGALNLEELHSLVREEGESFTSEKIAELYYGKHSVEQYATLRLALVNDRIYFKRKDDEFMVRPPETIEELKRHEEALSRKIKAQEVTMELFRQRLTNPSAPIPATSLPLLETLEELAAGVTDIEHGRLKDAKEFLTEFCEKNRLDFPVVKEKRAFHLLKAIHHFTDDTNLAIIRHGVPTRFSAAIHERARVLKSPTTLSDFPAAEQGIRQDFTNLRCVTIDDTTTKDMDDALSVEQTQDGFRLGIHISDVATLIPEDSELDKEAKHRTTSLYLAGNTVNMFPEEISDNKCSLVAGEVRPVISYMFDVDRNFSILGGKAIPAIIKVAQKMNYSDVATALEHGDRELSLLHSISATYESARIEKGAMKVSKKEVLIYPVKEGGYYLHEIDEDDPARALISELMVLANSLVADIATKNKIPMAFRSQPQPEDDMLPNSMLPPEGPAYDFYLRSRLKKSLVSLIPQPHASLGLPAYLQATSPIRRYMDLVHGRQILSFLVTGKPRYNASEIRSFIDDVEPRLANASQVSKETRRYWLLRYLKYLHEQRQSLTGTVVRLDGRTPLVELEKLYSTVFARLRPGTRVGDKVALRILTVDPEQDYLKLEQE